MPDIEKLLQFDPLSAGEELTGISYKDPTYGEGFDNPAAAVGFLLMQKHSAAKERVLTETDDTLFSNTLSRYRRIIEKAGFEEVLADSFRSGWGYNETFFIFARRDGLLLKFDTFNTHHVNSGSVYYNWKPSVPVNEVWNCVSSGGWTDNGILCGYHDALEALIHKINKLRNRGEFVLPWVKRPFLWLLHYDEPKVAGYDHKAITEGRIDRLPEWVKDFIGKP